MALFGYIPSERETLWNYFAQNFGVKFITEGAYDDAKLVGQHKNWIITLDIFMEKTDDGDTSTFTRLRAPFYNLDDFRFHISFENTYSRFIKKLGMQDILIGNRQFDNTFLIRGSDEEKVYKIFKQEHIQDLIWKVGSQYMRISSPAENSWFKRKFPQGVDELQLMVYGVVKNMEKMGQMFTLFAEVLDELSFMDVADDERKVRKFY